MTRTFSTPRLPRLNQPPTPAPSPTRGSSDLSAGAQTFTNTGAGYGNGQDTGFHNVPQGSLTVSEAGHAPSSLSDYDSSVSCNSGKNGAAGTSHTFTANYGDVIRSDEHTSQLQSHSDVESRLPPENTSSFIVPLELPPTAPTLSPSTTLFRSGQDTGFHNVPQGSLTVSEAGHAPSSLSDYDSSVSCNSGKNGAAGTSHTFTANYGDVI